MGRLFTIHIGRFDMEKIQVPGWDAITQVFEAQYPGQNDPVRQSR